MRIKVYDKAIEVLQKKIRLLKSYKLNENDILSSYIVNMDEAYTTIQYYFIRLKTGQMALYMLPSLTFLAGEDILDKKTYEKISKKEYKDIDEMHSNELTDSLFYELKGKYNNTLVNELIFHPYNDGFSYLASLYYRKLDDYKPAYKILYERVKTECDNLGIVYETNPEKIVEEKLKIYQKNDRYKLDDVTICRNKESLDKYYNSIISTCQNSKKLERKLSDLNYLKASFIEAYTGEFLIKANYLILALTDINFPNREVMIKNYMEFFIAKDYAFELVNYIDKLINQGTEIQITMEKERFNKNLEFMNDLENLIQHDDSTIYRYHATTSEESAHQILKDGFYLYSSDLDSTTYQEFTVDNILTYAYGNGFRSFGDYIVIISDPKEKDIVRKLTEEEQENILICPRRDAMIGTKPKHIVDTKYIVAIVDKEHERVILNPEYQNNEKKQL